MDAIDSERLAVDLRIVIVQQRDVGSVYLSHQQHAWTALQHDPCRVWDGEALPGVRICACLLRCPLVHGENVIFISGGALFVALVVPLKWSVGSSC